MYLTLIFFFIAISSAQYVVISTYFSPTCSGSPLYIYSLEITTNNCESFDNNKNSHESSCNAGSDYTTTTCTGLNCINNCSTTTTSSSMCVAYTEGGVTSYTTTKVCKQLSFTAGWYLLISILPQLNNL